MVMYWIRIVLFSIIILLIFCDDQDPSHPHDLGSDQNNSKEIEHHRNQPHHHHHHHSSTSSHHVHLTYNPLHNVSSPEFQKLAQETYQKVLPCINSTWIYEKNQKKPDFFEFPIDAQEHYELLKNRTECYRSQHIHEYSGYSGPWIENIFISKFIDRPLSSYHGLIPLFIQWIDNQILRGRHFDYIYSELGELLRPNVLYLAISQGDVGLGKIGTAHPNILVLSAGGYGHCVIPLVKGEIEYISPPKKYEVDIGFYGTVNQWQTNRPQMLESIKTTAKEVKLSYRDGSGPNWKMDMANTRFNLAPRGYGRSSFRFAESLQIGRIPVFMYSDLPWIPYQGSNISIEKYGFFAGLTQTENTLPEVVHRLKNVTEIEYEEKMRTIQEIRQYFTYPGIVHQIELFLKDPFGPNGGYITCTKHPRTERCCGR